LIATDTRPGRSTRRYIVIYDADSSGTCTCTGTTTNRGNGTWTYYENEGVAFWYEDCLPAETNKTKLVQIPFKKWLVAMAPDPEIKDEKPSPVFYPRPELKRKLMACNRWE
jgi:hypothetical protein